MPRLKRGHKKFKFLELELHTETNRRRELEDCASAVERIRNRSDTRRTAIDEERVVLFDSALAVEDVEPVDLQPELFAFTDRDRIVGAEVQVVDRGRAIAARNRIDGRTARIADKAEVRAEGPAGYRHRLHDELPDLLGQLIELLVGKAP